MVTFADMFFSQCALVMRLVQAAFVIRVQEGNTQGAGDPGGHTTTDPFSILVSHLEHRKEGTESLESHGGRNTM